MNWESGLYTAVVRMCAGVELCTRSNLQETGSDKYNGESAIYSGAGK